MATELRTFASATTDLPGIRVGSLAAAALRRVVAWDARYRERCRLADLSDATLRDIGRSRGDIDAEARRLA